jgi:hypothetical protein
MGTRITAHEGVVALYDSTSGTAFGPVFDTPDDADDFLDWLKDGEKVERTIPFNNDNVLFLADPRIYRANELDELIRVWKEETK